MTSSLLSCTRKCHAILKSVVLMKLPSGTFDNLHYIAYAPWTSSANGSGLNLSCSLSFRETYLCFLLLEFKSLENWNAYPNSCIYNSISEYFIYIYVYMCESFNIPLWIQSVFCTIFVIIQQLIPLIHRISKTPQCKVFGLYDAETHTRCDRSNGKATSLTPDRPSLGWLQLLCRCTYFRQHPCFSSWRVWRGDLQMWR